MRKRLVALAALAFVSRLPQLLSPHLLVDGDESVLGLMAKHFAQHGEFPLFFWGQRYGLATVEAGAAAVAFRVAGVGPVPLKIAMLALWTIGVLCFFAALARTIGERAAFWSAALLILMPAWAVWSMKARGGYLTAFAAMSLLMWILSGGARASWRTWPAAGLATALIYLAQPIWLPGALAIAAAALIERRRPSSAALFATTALAPIAMVKLWVASLPETWAGPPLGNPSIWGSRIRAWQQLYTNLSGSYYLTTAIDPPGPATRGLAAAWCGAIVLLVAVQFFRFVARRFNRVSHVLFAAVWCTLLANWFLLFARDGRYLLPLSALLVALASVDAADLLPRRAAVGVTAAMLVAGAVSMAEFRSFSFLWTNAPGGLSEAKRLQLVINSLTSRGATHAFSMNGLLDTQLIFYSDERVVARWATRTDRHPEYADAVNRALARGEPIGVVGYTNTSGAPGCWDVPICTGDIEHLASDPERIHIVDGKYFVYVGADRSLLERLRFELPE